MKKRILYAIFILLLFLPVYWLNKDAPIQYQWTPTFASDDRQPFGAFVFDRILEDSWTDKYYHNYYSFYDLKSKKINIPESETDDNFDEDNNFAEIIPEEYNLLVIANHLRLDSAETLSLLNYVEKGGSVILAAENFYGLLKDTLNFYVSNPVFPDLSILSFKQEDEKVNFYSCDSLQNQLIIPKLLVKNFFTFNDEVFFATRRKSQKDNNHAYYDSLYRISYTADEKTISLRYSIGQGNLILISNPLIFTNYGILNDSINPYIWKHLAYLKGKPLVRTEFYETGSQGGKSRSAFRVILSERALRWAYYTTLAGILVFMIFTAKRKQKIIPVIKPPVNKMLAFVRSIAGLYMLKNNNADILLKKQIYWGEELKRKYGIDTVNEQHNFDFYQRVAAKTRKPVDEIRRLFAELTLIDETSIVTDDDMLRLVAKMNEF